MSDTTLLLEIDDPIVPGPVKAEVERVLAKPAPFVAARVTDKRQTDLQLLIEALMRGVALRPLDVRRADRQARARQAVLEGAEWLTAEQIGERGGFSSSNLAAPANRWKQEGKVFAITHDGPDRFARYALDESFRPVPTLATVLHHLGPVSPWRVAIWFESANSWLDGARPRERLASDPQAVLHAAERYRSSGAHG